VGTLDTERAPIAGRPESENIHRGNCSAAWRAWQAVVNWYEWADPLGVVFAAAIAGLALLLVAGLVR
jgi:hypothetical protein